MKIEIGKDYVTSTWVSPVRIICTNRKVEETGTFSDSPVVGLTNEGNYGESVDFWRLDGTHALNSGLDLVDASEILLKNLKMDDPVEVKDVCGGNWLVRHYAGRSIEGILVWSGGCTSKTVHSVLLKHSPTRGAVEYSEFRAYKDPMKFAGR